MNSIAKAKIIVVFADIRGSSRWTRRMAEDEDARHAFMLAYDKECRFYKERTVSKFYKRLGDGRMFAHELNGNSHSEVATKILIECLGLIKRVDRLITKLPSPRPAGFRMRLFAGMVNKEIYSDGEQDWVGYIPNSCHKFLSVASEIQCITHETIKELITPKAARENKFTFTLLEGQRRCPDGVDREDLEALWAVKAR